MMLLIEIAKTLGLLLLCLFTFILFISLLFMTIYIILKVIKGLLDKDE